jgi:hypothetical protein
MPIMADEDPITLKEVQLRLGVAQHVLIHLCEKGVIIPDFAETSGRGKRREFSQRNLFEFAVSLALRDFEMSVATTAFVVRLLRAFERAMAKVVDGFALPAFFIERDIELKLNFYDGRVLVFAARGGALPKPLILSVTMGSGISESGTRPRLVKLDELPQQYDGRLELDLTRIARRILK